MKKTIVTLASAAALLGSASFAVAQYTGPASTAAATSQANAASGASGYSGPSSVALVTTKQLIETGKDNQHVRLQGRIVSHDGGKNYTFADEAGRISVEISAKRFPVGQPISGEQRVELLIEVDKDWNKTEYEVDQIRVLP
ncbi:YgiW/YdeI family stress tolerance OB fold protein [soil metagenome]